MSTTGQLTYRPSLSLKVVNDVCLNCNTRIAEYNGFMANAMHMLAYVSIHHNKETNNGVCIPL